MFISLAEEVNFLVNGFANTNTIDASFKYYILLLFVHPTIRLFVAYLRSLGVSIMT